MLMSKDIIVGALLYFIFVPVIFFISIVVIRITPINGYGWIWGLAFVVISLICLMHPFPKQFRETTNSRKKRVPVSEIISSTVYFSLIALAESFSYGLLLYHYHLSPMLTMFVISMMFIMSMVGEVVVFYYYFIYPKKPRNL